MAASISKDQIIEFIGKYRDILVLVLILALAGWAYLQLREPLAKSVEDIIAEGVRNRGQAGEGQQGVDAGELVQELESKRPFSVYRKARNPFGTPAEQLRLRQEVKQLYETGINLYKNGKYELAIQQFNRVIRMDVTETRIEYPIPPSEYIRLAERQVKIRDLDNIVAQADQKIQQAQGLENSDTNRAIKMYESAHADLKGLLEVDPQGEAMGQARFDQITNQVAQLEQTITNLKRQTLSQNVSAATNDLSRALEQASTDVFSLVLASVQAREVQAEMNEVDPNGEVVATQARNQLGSLIQRAESTLADSLESIAQQARQNVSDAAKAGEFERTHQLVESFVQLAKQYPDNDTLTAAELEILSVYLGGVAEAGRQELKRITEAFQQGDYSSYDPEKKQQVMGHISRALTLGAILTDTDRAQLAKLEDTLRRLEPPPPLDSAYDLLEFRPTGGVYRVRLKVKETGKEVSLRLRPRRKDDTGFRLGQVDTKNRVVILSKLPEYAPSQFQIPER